MSHNTNGPAPSDREPAATPAPPRAATSTFRAVLRAEDIHDLEVALGCSELSPPAITGAVIHLADHDVIIRVVPRKPEVQA